MDPKLTLRKWLERHGASDAEGVAHLYSASAVEERIPGKTVSGQSAIRKLYEEEFAMPKKNYEIINIFEAIGNWVLLEWRDEEGSRSCSLFHICDDRITLRRSYNPMQD